MHSAAPPPGAGAARGPGAALPAAARSRRAGSHRGAPGTLTHMAAHREAIDGPSMGPLQHPVPASSVAVREASAMATEERPEQ
mmetsp:Transcript_53449/g.148093  ORF Transcript_53449/g.148093 Transcript_53449/m.148093 type:complete len:83 (+) Transcript_53449:125-373(+)